MLGRCNCHDYALKSSAGIMSILKEVINYLGKQNAFYGHQLDSIDFFSLLSELLVFHKVNERVYLSIVQHTNALCKISIVSTVRLLCHKPLSERTKQK